MKAASHLAHELCLIVAALFVFALFGTIEAAGGTQKVVVANDCPIPLWIHFTETPYTAPINGGAAKKMNPMDTLIYDSLPDFGSGRCWAYYIDPGNKTSQGAPLIPQNGFVEMTVSGGPNGVQNYNISCVDYATLPVKVVGGSPTCIPTMIPVTFKEMQYQLKHGCPTQVNFFDSTVGLGICLGSYDYCIQPGYDTGNIYCYKMWLGHHHPGTEVYGGSLLASSPDHEHLFDSIAAWQRGTFYQDADSSHYWKNPEQDATGKWINPYNLYAKWIHKTLNAQVYAFANDDHQNQSGFQACTHCGQLNITWCPCEGPGGCPEDPLKTAVKETNFSKVMRLQEEKFIRYTLFTPNGRILRSGSATSMEEVSRSISNKLSLSRGVYFVALYGKDGNLAASKRILASW